MMAIGTMLVLGILAAELVYQTEVYNSTVFHLRDELRARLLARSGLRLAQLQLTAATKAKAKIKSLGLGDEGLADQIWQTPLILPPPPLPGLSTAETEALGTFQKSLGFDGSLSVAITGESDRLNLNQLVWVSKEQAQKAATGGAATGGTVVGGTAPALTPEKRKEILDGIKKSFIEAVDQLLQQKRQDDDNFRDRYATVTAETLIGNLAAFMDPETQLDGDNRDKNDYYARVEPFPYSPKNAPLVSESELAMVKGFDDTLTDLFAENFTIQSTAGLNVNKASPALLRALIPELGPDEVDRIVKRRSDASLGGPFAKAEDFWNFLETLGNFADAKKRFEERGMKLLEAETAYRAVVTAKSSGASKTWLARIGPPPPEVAQPVGQQAAPEAAPATPDLGKSAEQLAKEAEEKKKAEQGKADNKVPYIIYLKAD